MRAGGRKNADKLANELNDAANLLADEPKRRRTTMAETNKAFARTTGGKGFR